MLDEFVESALLDTTVTPYHTSLYTVVITNCLYYSLISSFSLRYPVATLVTNHENNHEVHMYTIKRSVSLR